MGGRAMPFTSDWCPQEPDAFSPLTPIVNAASIFRILGLPTGLAN